MKLSLVWFGFALSFSAFAVPQADLTKAHDKGEACAALIRQVLPERPDTKKLAFETCLSSYIQLPTINPPGSEELGVEFLEAVFKGISIPTLRITAKPVGQAERISLIASLSPTSAAMGFGQLEPYAWGPSTGRPAGAAAKPSVILLNHIDVVDVFPDQWAKPDLTFSGQILPFPGKKETEPFLWGRGALDMKGIAMLQLFSMAQLKAEKFSFNRDIHFLAVADEEQSAMGATEMVRSIRKGGDLEALLGAKVLLGEGGFGVKDVVGAGSVLHLLGGEEKGGAWLKLKHSNPQSLLTTLARLQLAPKATDGFVKEATKWGCELKAMSTPKAKVNVVPSRLDLDFTCKQNWIEAKVKTAFESNDSKAALTRHNGGWRVTLQTPSSSHGSIGFGHSALESAAVGLQRLGLMKLQKYSKPDFFRYYQTEGTRLLIDNLGKHHSMKYVPHFKSLHKWISWWSILEQRALKELGNQLSSERLFRTSCTWTSMAIDANGTEAWLDCRLMHPKAMGLVAGNHEGKQFAGLIKKESRDNALAVEVIEEWNYSASSATDPAMAVMKRELEKEGAKAVTAFLFPGGTDNHLFRDSGGLSPDLAAVPSYGFLPLELTIELIATQHGSNERFPVQQTDKSLRIYFGVVSGLSR